LQWSAFHVGTLKAHAAQGYLDEVAARLDTAIGEAIEQSGPKGARDCLGPAPALDSDEFLEWEASDTG
jgi:hypothetical protein